MSTPLQTPPVRRANRTVPTLSPGLLDWDKLRIFRAVADAGSFTHAGALLNLSQSAVSRQISALEESLRTPLFHRHARGLILTEQGEVLFEAVRDVTAKLAHAEAQLAESKERPTGLLRVTATVAFGSTWLAPRLRRFFELHPEIRIQMVIVDSELDLSMREADCAIRMHPPRQADLIQKHLLTVRSHVYAAPSYVEKRGSPRTTADLDDHDLIIYGEDPNPPFPGINWLTEAGSAPGRVRDPILQVNNTYAILRAVEAGVGLATLPDFIARGSPGLIRVLPDVEGPSYEGYFVYPEEMRNSKRIAVFRDFLMSQVAGSTF
jgi:DNA-binding transcriptional LysR family regulator